MDFKQLLQELLPRVQKPARYLGNEWNAVKKDHHGVAAKAVLAFPDLYEVGMSNLGLQILYEAVNCHEDLLLERTFAPAADMESLMRHYELPLFSLESCLPVKEFDLLGFSLQYELSFTNVLNMLDLAGIPLYADRRRDEPLVIGGGPAAFNPEPLASFFDLFLLGDGEEAFPEILRRWSELSRQGAGRQEILLDLSAQPGVYVPSLYRPVYSG
ncbi:MAG TPA: B12-binding domain-containing radical SAM protein, partial [Firmicutes bacterium]|nr:B12-binding domain-containing radical SAM protein [Bacillota bacterium]